MKIFAYCRISTKEEDKKQSMERQEFIISEYADENNFKIDKIFYEDMSGKTMDRPVFVNLTENIVREEDVIIFSDLDRIGRNADGVIEQLKVLKRRKIKICIIDTPYLNDWEFVTNSSGKSNEFYNMTIDIVITLKAHIAEQERIKISDRTKKSLAAKKAKGQKLGRPESKKKEAFLLMYPRVESKAISINEALKILEISRNQFYVLKRKYIC